MINNIYPNRKNNYWDDVPALHCPVLFNKPRDSGMTHLQEKYKELLQKNCDFYDN